MTTLEKACFNADARSSNTNLCGLEVIRDHPRTICDSLRSRCFFVVLLSLALSGCSNLQIKDGGLVVGKDTTASIEDVGAVRLTGRY